MSKTYASKCILKWFLYLFPALVTCNAAAQNLVQNGTFNATSANWTFFAPGTATETTYFESTYGGLDATNHVAEVDNQCNLRQTVSVVPGTMYVVSLRYTRRTGNGTAPLPTAITLTVSDATGSYVNDTLFGYNTTWQWQCASYQFIPTTSTVTLSIGNLVAPGQSPSTLGTIVDDITITPAVQPLVFTGASCPGATFTLTAPSYPGNAGAVYNYAWTGPNGFTDTASAVTLHNIQTSDNGTYICTMNVNGCATVTASYLIDVVQVQYHMDREICNGSTYNFYGRQLYQAGIYDTLIPSNNTTCDSLIFLTLTVHPKPDARVTPAGPITICKGDTASIAVINPSAASTYQWYLGNGPIGGETGPLFRTAQDGVYQLRAITSKGCRDSSDKITVTVSTPPVAEILMEYKEKICLYDTVHLESANTAAAYLWEPDALFRLSSVFNTEKGVAIIKDKKTNIILTVFDENGCHNSDSLEVDAISCCAIFIPNAFTPNGDGANDWFLPEMRSNQVLVSFRIFDRWGKKVYDLSTGSRKGWNGAYPDGTPAASGTYMYHTEYACDNGNNRIAKGDIVLLR